MSLDHDQALTALSNPVNRDMVFVDFTENLVDPGQPAAWTARDQAGSLLYAHTTGLSASNAKITFTRPDPLKWPQTITYNNALGTGYDVLLRPLSTGSDFPVIQ